MLSLLLTFGALMLQGQTVEVGATGGVSVTDQISNSDESRPYVIGPTVELRLKSGFALEGSALYRRLGNSYSFFYDAENQFQFRRRSHSLEAPVLGKYYFRERDSSWRPFLGSGFAFRMMWHETATTGAGRFFDSGTSTDRGHLEVGATFAAGVRFQVGRFALLPQLRYTRWGTDQPFVKKNQADFMLGIRF